MFVHMIGLLNTKQLLPVVIFTFSKRRCEEYASSLSKTDLCSSLEKSEIHVFIERSLVRLRGTDKELPQILRMRDLLSRGIAVHHGGLLPIIKEVRRVLPRQEELLYR
jgi:antiviral helicase SKI2